MDVNDFFKEWTLLSPFTQYRTKKHIPDLLQCPCETILAPNKQYGTLYFLVVQ